MENVINDDLDSSSSDNETDQIDVTLIKRLIINLTMMNLMNKLLKLRLCFNNNKSLIVYVNHALFGFYLQQFGIHKYYGFNSTCLKHTILNR